MNIQYVLSEVQKLEREKAQLEVKAEQIKAEKDKIEEALKARGLNAKTLPERIEQLEAEITEELRKLGISVEGAASAAASEDIFESI